MGFFFALGQLIINGLLLGGVYAVMASGLSLIFGVVRVLQISHSVLIILGCYFSYSVSTSLSLDPILSLLITIPAMFFIGIAVYRFIVAPLENAPPVAVLLAFFGLILALENTIGLIWTTNYNAIHSAYQGKSFLFLGFTFSLPRAIAFSVACLVIFTLLVFLRSTETGRAIRAVSQDRDTAQVLGVDVDKIFVIVFGVSASLAAVGGSLMGIIYSFYPALHWRWLGVVFSVVVLGGLGQVGGAIIAALIIGLAESLASYFIGAAWGPFIAFAILIITLVQRPQGLLGIKGKRI
ncbi:MAG: branched-chain amino acid ABC transporter permease [Desulfobacteraceae bacterium]|jgi:branched-chain amino acid transport system permease protein